MHFLCFCFVDNLIFETIQQKYTLAEACQSKIGTELEAVRDRN